jgi:hypothetical protein
MHEFTFHILILIVKWNMQCRIILTLHSNPHFSEFRGTAGGHEPLSGAGIHGWVLVRSDLRGSIRSRLWWNSLVDFSLGF